MATANYTPNKFAIQRVFTINLFRPATGELLARLEDCKTSGLANEATTVYAMGGAGNPYLVGFSHSRRARLNVENALFSTETMAVQVGNDVVVGVNEEVMKYEKLTVASDRTAVTAFKAIGTENAEVGYAYVLRRDGTKEATLAQGATADAGKFTYSKATKTMTFNAADVQAGDKIAVVYKFHSGSTAKTISINADKFGGIVKIVADGLVRDVCTGEDYQCQIIVEKAKVDDNWEFATTADGDPAVQGLNLEFLKECDSEALYQIIIFNELDAEDITVTAIEATAAASVAVAGSTPISTTATLKNATTDALLASECTYTSASTSIATVSAAGVITGVATGSTTITVTYAADTSITDTVAIVVHS